VIDWRLHNANAPTAPRQYRAALGLNIHPGLLHLS
jgi:hypothetical protein